MTVSHPEFLPGLELSRIMFAEAVKPILDEAYPQLAYAAARIGPGSEVLGFDTARSADHDWGPRLGLFLTADQHPDTAPAIGELLGERLPKHVRGWPTHFRHSDDPHDPVGHMQHTDGPVEHRVAVHGLDDWLTGHLGAGTPWAAPGPADWLAVPQQKLAELTAGAVFHDGPGTLTAIRERMAWYPDQVWRYLLACQWQRISEEEAFVGRCAETGDELGSAVVAARLVRDLMRLCLLMERRYAPYSKWLGSAFAHTAAAAALTPMFRNVLAATDYPAREEHLCQAYETVAALHNATGLTGVLDPARRRYYTRPFLVLHADRFARALAATVTDPALAALPLTGAVDQWADSTAFIGNQGAIRAAVTELGQAR